MRTKLLILAMGVAAVATAAIPALVGAQDDKTKLIAKPLSGDQEVPGPGDEQGSGSAKVTLDPANEEVCFVVKFKNVENVNAAHIHKGAEGDDGEIVVELFADTSFESPQDDCVEAERRTINKIARRPEKYYVNVHNEEFPDGAIRGQLENPEDQDGGGGGGGGGGTS